LSPEGCYEDSFDYEALDRVLLDPLGPGGDRRYRNAVYDKVTDTAVSPPDVTARPDAVLLFDGVFLLRPELVDRWELRIFVSASFEQTLARARIRDRELYGSAAGVERRFRERYLPSQEFYSALVRPTDLADVVVQNDDPERPGWDVRPTFRDVSRRNGT
jgi:uridine kinase